MSTNELTRNAEREQARTQKKQGSKKRVHLLGQSLTVDGGFDIIFLLFVFALLGTGLVMLFSASYINAEHYHGDSMHFITRQAAFAAIGVVLMFLISKVNPQVFKKIVPLITVISLALLVIVLFYYVEIPGKENIKRWMPLFGSASFQPSDVAKFGLILTLAWMFDRYKKQIETKWYMTFIICGVVVLFCGLVALESHLSGTVLMFLIGAAVIYLGGVDNRFCIACIVIAAVALAIFIPNMEHILKPYQVDRITEFINPVKDYSDTGDRWQTNQSLFALGSGGFYGLGLGNSRQKYLFMPEPQNDFILAIVGEELGFLRTTIIILMFAGLVWRGFTIAGRTNDLYEKLVVLGISIQVGVQTILNILVVTDTMPNTGISLPFFSYGGTALLILLCEMGFVLGISRSGPRKNKRIKVNKDAQQ